MRLATICRRTLDCEGKTYLDGVLKSKNYDQNILYIEELKSKQHTPLCDEKTWPLLDDTDDDVIVIGTFNFFIMYHFLQGEKKVVFNPAFFVEGTIILLIFACFGA